jgi:YfiH family protein
MRFTIPGNEKHRRNLAEILEISGDFVAAEQVHKNKIAVVGVKDLGTTVPEVDGLVTTEPGVNLIIRVADCLPILAFDPTRNTVGIAHAGWGGTLVKIAGNLIKTFIKLGSKSTDIIVGFGPAIEFCHYEVSKERVAKITRAGLESALLKSVSGKTFFDLKAANLKQLMSVGILKSNIDMSLKSCTYENLDFYSWRREKPNLSGNFAAVIGLPAGRQD